MQVPTYTSKERLQPTPWDPKLAATIGNEIADVGEGLKGLSDQIKKVQNLNDRSKAIGILSSANDATHDKYRTDSNLAEASKNSQSDLEENVRIASESIHDPEARNLFMLEAVKMKDSKQTAIDTMIQGRILQQGKFDINNRTRAFQQEYNYANSPNQEADVKKRYNDYIDERINSNGVNPEWAEAHRQITNYNFGYGKLLNDISIIKSPDAAKTIRDKIDNGDYGSLRDVDSASANKKLDRKEEILNNQQKKNMINIQERNARDLDMMFRTNDPNLEQHAEEKYFTGQIDKKTFDAYTGGNKKASLIDPTSNGAAYLESLAYIADPDTKIRDVRNFIMDKYNQGQLSPQDRNKLYDLSIRPMGDQYKSVKDVIGLEESKKDEQDTSKAHLNSALNWLHDSIIPFGQHLPSFTDKGTPEANRKAVIMGKRFLKKITDGNVSPEQYIKTANDVIKEQHLLDRPEISAYGEDGRTEQDENGNRSVTTSDGETQPEGESAGDRYGDIGG